jgi:hypothetical protein
MEGSVRYPRVCRRGHVIVGPGDEREGRCLVCRVASKRRYEQSAKGQAVQLRYNRSAKGEYRASRYEWSSKGILRRVRAELSAAYAARDALR